MSIASEIERLSGVRNDIFNSITNKGVTVPEGSTFSSCPSLIDQIEGGGGGTITSMINPTFTASGYASGYRPFTATQIEVPVYDYITYTGDIPSFSNGKFTLNDYKTTADSPQTATFTGTIQQWASPGGSTTGTLMSNETPTATNYGTWSIQQQTQTDITFIFNITAYPVDTNQFYCSNMNWSWGITSVSPYTASYREQTGTDIPYPTYPTTTTGYITNDISGKESFTGSTTKVPNIYVSGFKNVVYEDSPEGGATAISPVNMNLTSFSSNMLKNNITAKTNYALNSTAYTYNYGTTQTAYSGFEGI